jgi:hypothetical protein
MRVDSELLKIICCSFCFWSPAYSILLLIPGLHIDELPLGLFSSFKVSGTTVNDKLKWQGNTEVCVKKPQSAYTYCSCSTGLRPSS